eukprot:11118998-Alexandrium_andersonii.AAC.1
MVSNDPQDAPQPCSVELDVKHGERGASLLGRRDKSKTLFARTNTHTHQPTRPWDRLESVIGGWGVAQCAVELAT